jgi:hypothetical protein
MNRFAPLASATDPALEAGIPDCPPTSMYRHSK